MLSIEDAHHCSSVPRSLGSKEFVRGFVPYSNPASHASTKHYVIDCLLCHDEFLFGDGNMSRGPTT